MADFFSAGGVGVDFTARDNFTATLSRIESAVEKFARVAEQQASQAARAVERVGKAVSEDHITAPLKRMESTVIRTVGAISAALASIRVISFEIRAAGDFQKELLNIQKTTEFADEGIRQMSKGILELSKNVNVSAVDLAKIAAIGGQLGLGREGKEALLQFTDTASRMASVLDVTVEDAGNGIAKIVNIFKIGLQDAERIGSAFNELSNNSTASGSDLLDVVQRIGDAGGVLKLTDSLALAATGRDFGLTLETIGTSFSKIFSNMQAEAMAFGKFMGMSTREWSDTVKRDGVGALELYLAKLRTLTNDERARAIEQLSGGGRIASLMQKLAGDTQNTVLRRNKATAELGFSTGTSALREQETVLKGFNAQVQILKNNATALAIEIGDKALPALTAMVISLSNWFNDPSVKEGFKELASFFGSMFMAVTKIVTAIASLNINWVNLIKMATILLGLRIAEHMFKMASAAESTKTALVGLSKVTFSSLVTGLDRVVEKSKAAVTGLANVFKPGKTAADVIDANGQTPARPSAAAAAGTALASVKQLGLNAIGLGEAVAARDKAITEAKMQAAHALGELERAEIRKTMLAEDLRVTKHLANRQKETAAAMLAYEKAAALDALRQGDIVRNQQRTSKLLAAIDQADIDRINAKYDKRQADAQRRYEQSVNEARKRYLDTTVGNSQAVRVARDADANAGREVDEARRQRAAADQRLLEVTQNKVVTFGSVVSGVLTMLGRGLSMLLSGAMWLTAAAAILDMLGLLDPLIEKMKWLGDVTGIYTEKTRKQAVADKEAAAAAREKADAQKALMDEYRKRADGGIGFDPVAARAAVTGAKGDANVVAPHVVETVDQAAAMLAVMKESERVGNSMSLLDKERASALARTTSEYAAQLAKVNALKNKVSELRVLMQKGEVTVGSVVGAENDVDQAAKVLIELQQKMEEARTLAESSNAAAQTNIAASVEIYTKNLDSMVQHMADTLHQQTVDQATELGTQLLAVREQSEAIAKERADLSNKLKQVDKDAPGADQRKADEIRAKLVDVNMRGHAASAEMSKLVLLFRAASREAASLKWGADDRFLSSLLEAPIEVLRSKLNLFSFAKEKGVAFTGVLTNNTENKEGDARALLEKNDLSRAHLALEKAKIEARLDLVQAGLRQVEQYNEDHYRRGLSSLGTYYDTKLALENREYSAERERLQQTIKAAQNAVREAGENNNEANKITAQKDLFAARAALDTLEATHNTKRLKLRQEREQAEREAFDRALDNQVKYMEALGDSLGAAELKLAKEHRDPTVKLITEMADAYDKYTKAIGTDGEAAAKSKLDEATRRLTIELDVKNFAEAKAKLDFFKNQLDTKVTLGLIPAPDMPVRIAEVVNLIDTTFAPAMDKLKSEIDSAEGERKLTLQRQLEALQLTIIKTKDEVFSLASKGEELFKKGIELKVFLGLSDPFRAGEQLAEYSRTVLANAKLGQIVANDADINNGVAGAVEKGYLLRLEYMKLKQTISEVAEKVNADVRTAFITFLDAALNKTAKLGDAFRTMLRSIAQSMQKAVIENLVDTLAGPLIRGKGSIGDIFSGMMGSKAAKDGSSADKALWVQIAGGGGVGVPGTEASADGNWWNKLWGKMTGKSDAAQQSADAGQEVIDACTGQITNSATKAADTLRDGGFGFDTFFRSLGGVIQQGLNALRGAGGGFLDGVLGLFNFGGSGASAAPAPWEMGLAEGGLVSGPGTETSDSIPARLSNNEYVVRASATKKWLPLLKLINNDRFTGFKDHFAEGGLVTVPQAGGSQQVNHISMTFNGDGRADEAKGSGGKNSQELANVLSGMITERLVYEKRPGGLLYG